MSGLFSIVDDMLYPGTSLTNGCSNTSIEIVNNPSNHVSWYPPDLPCDVVLQSWQGLGIVLINPLFQTSPENVVTWVKVRGVGGPREICATRNESVARKILLEEFQ